MANFPEDYSYDEQNPFAQILRGEIPATVVYENEAVFAFKDIHPKAKIHILVIPKKPYICYNDFLANASAKEVQAFFKGVQATVKKLNISQFSLITNNGAEAGQIVFHFHVHLLADQTD